MCQFQISDLSFCEVVTEKEIEVKGGLTIANLVKNIGVMPLSRRVSLTLSELPNIGNISLNVQPIPSQDGSTVEKLENKDAGISGLTVTSKDGTSKVTTLAGSNFSLISTSIIQSS